MITPLRRRALGRLLVSCALAWTTSLAAQNNFDLQLYATNVPVVVSLGQYFTCSLGVTTTGPDAPPSVVVTNRVPAGLEFVSARSSRGTVSYSSGLVTCAIEAINPYNVVTLTIEFKATVTGSFTNRAGAWSSLPETAPANNEVTFTTPVNRARFFGVPRPHTGYIHPRFTVLTNRNQVFVTGAWPAKVADLYNISTRTFDVPAGALIFPRSGHTATLMPNGLVLLAGGASSTGAATAEVYDPAVQMFRRVGDMLKYSYDHRDTLLADGRVLLCGGALATNELFNPVTETFSFDLSGLPCRPEGTRLPDGRYFQSGYNPSIYNPATGISTPTAPLKFPRFYWTATVIPPDKVLVLGGQANGVSDIAEIYDIPTGSFTLVGRMLLPREYHGTALMPDGTVLVVGGVTNYASLAVERAEVFDLSGSADVPGVGVGDTSFVEGSMGATNYLEFNVWLTKVSTRPVTIEFATVMGTAGATDWGIANHDFIPTNGLLTISAGLTNAIVRVAIQPDAVREPTETMSLSLGFPAQAWLCRSSATGTILDDDPIPTLALAPAQALERDTGLANLSFPLTLSAASLDPVSVNFATANLTAVAGADYVPVTGTVVFSPGETAKTIQVPAIGDLELEPVETFTVTLSSATNATIGNPQATGSILNDDGVPGALHHFDVDPILGIQLQTVPFPVKLTARDSAGAVVTTVPSPVRLSARTTNVVAANLDFEQPTLSPWTIFNNTPYAKTFEQVQYDIAGLGQSSTAVRTVAGGGTNGLVQEIFLAGGIPYTFKVSFATDMFGDDMSWYGAAGYIVVGSSNVLVGLPGGRPGSTGTAAGSLVYTPPSNGVYSLQVLIARDYYYGDALAVYIDDVQISYPLISPTFATNFVDGVWTGSVAALQSASNVTLHADDGAGHKGAGNAFDVQAIADLALSGSWTSSVPVLRTSDRLTINLAVTNRGPSLVADATVRCPLPVNVAFLSAAALPGTLTNDAGVLLWSLGPLPAGAAATASIQLRADLPGQFTNAFNILTSVVDLNTNDNAFAFPVEVFPPVVSIADAVALSEADGAATGDVFVVTLSGPSAQSISVDYLTVDGTATNAIDFFRTNGTVVFAPFATSALVRVFAIDDILDEPNRTFSILLTNAVNAVIGDGVGAGVLLDDDLPPTVSIADTSVVEGDSGLVNAMFPLTLSKPAIPGVSIRCTTSSGTADTNDYAHTVTTVTFPAGQTNATFSVPVRGNTVNESNETFTVTLSLPNGVTIAQGTATGTILNDDAVTNRFDHFEFNPVPSPQYVGRPFQLTARAVDFRGTNVAFGGMMTLVAQTDEFYTLRLFEDFEDGDLAGWTNAAGQGMVVSNVNDTAAGGSRSLRISGKASFASSSYSFRRAITNGRPNRISFAVRAAQTNAITGRMWGMAPGPYYLSFDFYMNRDAKGALMGLYSRNGFNGVPYVPDRWYQVDLNLNWTSRLISGRVDGVPAFTNVFFPDDPYSGLSYIGLQNSETGTSWFDTIHVFDSIYTNLMVTPSNLTGFPGGTWTGNVTLARPGTNAYFTGADTAEHIGRSPGFDVLAADLRLNLPVALTEGVGTVQGQVSIPITFPQPLVIGLTSSAPAELSVPATVTIPAGQTNATFNLTVINDSLLDGSQVVTVSAAHAFCSTGIGWISVDDNESTTVSLNMPPSVPEYVGVLNNAGRVTLAAAPGKAVTVKLSSSVPDALQVPPSVTISAGQTTATFNLTVIDNRVINGDRAILVTATVPNWVNASRVITVVDNEDALLRLTGPSQVSEEAGTAAYVARITITLETNLPVALTSSDTNVFQVPANVVIPAGATNVNFTASISDNASFDGAKTIRLTGAAGGFISATNTISVLDNEVHHLGFAPIEGARTSAIPFAVAVSARDINDGPIISFNGAATVAAAGGEAIVEPANVVLTGGQWLGNITVFTDQPFVSLGVTATNGLTGQSGYIQMVPPVVQIANVTSHDLVFSPITRRLWCLATNSGALTPLNPFTGFAEAPLANSPAPAMMAASGDGSLIHLVYNGSTNSFIREFDSVSRSVTHTWTNQYYVVQDISGMPDHPETVAIVSGYPGSVHAMSIFVYDHGIPRPNGYGAYTANVIEFGDTPDRLYGYDRSTSGHYFSYIKVDASGLTNERAENMMNDVNVDFTQSGGRVFTTTGKVFDTERAIQVGTCSSTPVLGDAQAGRYYQWLGVPSRLAAFDLHTSLPVGSTPVPGVSTSTGRMVRWNTNGLAFRAGANQVVLVRTPLLPSGPSTDLAVSVRNFGLPVMVSNTFTCVVTVSNRGPNVAQNAVLAQTIPTNLALVAVSSPGAPFATYSSGVVCPLPELTAGTSVDVRLTFRGLAMGAAAARVSVTSDSPDPDPANNLGLVVGSVGYPFPRDSVVELRQATGDIAYDPVARRIRMTVDNRPMELGNTLIEFDPLTGLFENPVGLDRWPGKLALSANGQYGYVGVTGNNIQRVDLTNRVVDLKFPTGYSYVSDMVVLRENPDVVVATVYENTVVYDKGVMRSNVAERLDSYWHYLELSDDPSIVYCTAPSVFSRVRIDAGGATRIDGCLWCVVDSYDFDLEVDGGVSTTQGGKVVDIATRNIITNIPSCSLALPDAASGRAYFLTGYPQPYTLQIHNLTNMAPIGSIAISNVTGTPRSLIRWGVDGLAFRTYEGQLFLIRTSMADDRDLDGLRDSWEVAYFGSIVVQAAAEDPDLDSFTNLQEQQAGLDPTAYDAMRFLYGRPASEGRFEMAVIAPLGGTHALMFSTNLSDWTPLLEFTSTNLPTLLYDTNPPPSGCSYRIAPIAPGP